MRRLLKGGTVIDTFPEVVARPETDVLIEDGRIAAVGPGLDGPGLEVDAEVIDATGRIVLPGFVDTHRHLWQTALRGITVDADLGGYFERVLGGYGARFRAEDVAAGNLVGALECLERRDHHGAGLFARSSGRPSTPTRPWIPWNAAGSGPSSATVLRR